MITNPVLNNRSLQRREAGFFGYYVKMNENGILDLIWS
jgi:hypothetical protein